MDTISTILKRRSIRKYQERKISEEDLATILRCAQAAPTAVNSREWEFIVVTEKELLKKVAECNGNAARMLPDAAAAIIVCGNLQKAYKNAPEYWIIDCAAAVQNILLSATELGIGSVWLGTYPQENKVNNIKALFNMPEHIVPHSVIALGYPDEVPTRQTTFEEDKVHYNKLTINN